MDVQRTMVAIRKLMWMLACSTSLVGVIHVEVTSDSAMIVLRSTCRRCPRRLAESRSAPVRVAVGSTRHNATGNVTQARRRLPQKTGNLTLTAAHGFTRTAKASARSGAPHSNASDKPSAALAAAEQLSNAARGVVDGAQKINLLDKYVETLCETGFVHGAVTLVLRLWRGNAVLLSPTSGSTDDALVAAGYAALGSVAPASSTLLILASALEMRIGARGAPIEMGVAASGEYRSEHAAMLLVALLKACDRDGCQRPTASAFNATLRVWAAHGLPRPTSSAARLLDGLGYRKTLLKQPAAASSGAPRGIAALNRGAYLERLRREVALTEGRTAAADSLLRRRPGDLAPVSEAAFLWQRRGGLWLKQRDKLPALPHGSRSVLQPGDRRRAVTDSTRDGSGARWQHPPAPWLARVSQFPLADVSVDARATLQKLTDLLSASRLRHADDESASVTMATDANSPAVHANPRTQSGTRH